MLAGVLTSVHAAGRDGHRRDARAAKPPATPYSANESEYRKVDGIRPYGKRRGSIRVNDPQPRSAYCKIREWAQSQPTVYTSRPVERGQCNPNRRPPGEEIPYRYPPLRHP